MPRKDLGKIKARRTLSLLLWGLQSTGQHKKVKQTLRCNVSNGAQGAVDGVRKKLPQVHLGKVRVGHA